MATYDTEESTDRDVIEPVEIETVKKYIGYSPTLNEDDRFLTNFIVSARERLENRMGCAIVRRTFVTRAYDLPIGERVSIPVRMPL